MKKWLYVIAILCSNTGLRAQSDSLGNLLQWESAFYGGFIIPHSPELREVSQSTPWGLSLAAKWLVRSEQGMAQCNCIPQKGILLNYFNFSNPDELGEALSVVPFFEPLIRPSKPLYFSVRVGLGLSYLSRVYDANDNPDNLFFSNPLSFFMLFSTRAYYRFHPSWQLHLSADYNHISNGGSRQPNKGMNFPMASVGLTYHPEAFVAAPRPTAQWNKERPYSWMAELTFSTKNTPETAEDEGTLTILGGAMLSISKRVSALSAWNLGAELIYDGYTREMRQRAEAEAIPWKGALLAGYQLVIGRISFSPMLGLHVYNPYRDTDLLFQRYILRYQVSQNWAVGASLRTHRQVADVFDFRLAYTF